MENKKYPSSVLIKFLVCSLVGIFLFFVPVSFNGKSTIPLDHIVNLVLKVPYFKRSIWNNSYFSGSIFTFLQKNLE